MGMIRPADSGTPDDHHNEMVPAMGGDDPRETSHWFVVVAFRHASGRHRDSARRVSRRVAVATALAGAIVVIAVALLSSPTAAWHLVACAGDVFIAYFTGH